MYVFLEREFNVVENSMTKQAVVRVENNKEKRGLGAALLSTVVSRSNI